jgi:hypothetical protein
MVLAGLTGTEHHVRGIFAVGLFGFSAVGAFRHALSRLGAPWYVWLLVPIFVGTVLVRKEAHDSHCEIRTGKTFGDGTARGATARRSRDPHGR